MFLGFLARFADPIGPPVTAEPPTLRYLTRAERAARALRIYRAFIA